VSVDLNFVQKEEGIGLKLVKSKVEVSLFNEEDFKRSVIEFD